MYLTGINDGLPAFAKAPAVNQTNCLASANGTSFAKAPAVNEKFPGLSTRKFKQTLRIMRLIIFLMLTGLLQVSARGTGQTISLSVSKAPIEQVFKRIEQQSGYSFVYFKRDMEKIGRISLDLHSVPLKEALDQCFNGLPFSYIIDEKNIIVKPQSAGSPNQPFTPAAALLAPIYAGVIMDTEGRPVTGVNIQVKGTQRGAISDASGRFTIDAAAGEVLVISSIGYETREIKLGTDTDLSILLKIKTNVIDTAVVNYVSTGYQQIARERATGAFSHVTSADLDKQIGVSSIQEKFRALLPGVLVDQGNTSIRGKSSLSAGTEPLVVIDGFATSLSLSTINPNDVESITVLRDAAAASIWGARASNGVVVIITKKGRNINSKPVFSFNSIVNVRGKPDMGALKLANARQMVDVELEALNKNWWSLTGNDNNQGYSRVFDIYRKQTRNEITQDEANRQYDVLRNNNAYAQDDLFFRTGVAQLHSLSVSGATALNRYYVSFIYQNNKDVSRRSDGQSFILAARNSYQFLPKLRFDADINLAYSKSNPNGVEAWQFADQRPYEVFIDASGNYNPVYEWGLRSVETNRAWEQKGYYNWDKNLKRDFDNYDKFSTIFQPRITLGLNYDVMKGLSVESRIQHERYDYRFDNYENEEIYSTRHQINLLTVQQPDGSLKYGIPPGTIYKTNSQSMQTTTWRNQVRFDREFNGTRHRISAIAGTELNRIASRYKDERYHNYDKQRLTYSTINEAELVGGIPGFDGRIWNYPSLFRPVIETENRYFSMYANGAYTFDNKYTVSASGRIDKSNLFGASINDKITPLYSIGAAWNISREQFFNVKAIDDLKLRVTTGVNGNIDRSTSKVLVAIPRNAMYSTGEDYLEIASPENKMLRWESTRSTNLGLDVAVLKNRVSLSIDYYVRKSYDLVGLVESDPSLGFANVYKNTAAVRNNGIDLRLNATVLDGAFRWHTNLYFSINKNEVTEVYNSAPSVDNYLIGGKDREVKGRPIDYFYSYRWAGLNNQGNPQVYNDKGEVISDISAAQQKIDWLEYSGTTVPKQYGSFINTFSWKGLSISPIIYFQFGHKMRLPTTYLNTYPGILSGIDQRWRKPGDEAFTDLPGLYPSQSEPYTRTQLYRLNNKRVADASFIRLSNVTLTYDLPGKLTGNLFRNIQLQVAVANAALWTANDEDIDPEAIDKRYGSLSFPAVRTWSFGLKVDL